MEQNCERLLQKFSIAEKIVDLKNDQKIWKDINGKICRERCPKYGRY